MSGMNSWLISLENRVSRLRYNAQFDQPENSEQELDRCHSLLEQIYNHAAYQEISIAMYIPRIKIIQDELFPNQSLEERYRNFSEYYLELGEDFIPMLFKALNPLEDSFTIIEY